MSDSNAPVMRNPRMGRTWKGMGIGFLGLGAACLGCCLAPLLGLLFATGAGAYAAVMLSSRPILTGVAAAISILAVVGLVWLRPWKLLLCLLPISLTTGCTQIGKCCAGRESATYPAVSRTELVELMAKGKITLIDANGTESFSEGHIPGALDFEAVKPDWPSGLPEDRSARMVVYCGGPRCMAWKDAALALTALGYTAVSHYPGGMQEWTEAENPSKGPDESAVSHARIDAGGSGESMPGCGLSPKAQASRIKELRADLFRRIESIHGEGGTLHFRFPDRPETRADLAEFIRFERDCCRSLRFSLDMPPDGRWVTLKVEGPAPQLSALKEIAQRVD